MKRMLMALLILALTIPQACAGAPQPTRTEMGYKMLQSIYETQGQFAFSPLSLKLALSMAAEGAAGDTRAQLLEALGVDGIPALDLSGYGQLKSANAVIVSDKIALLDTYASLLKDKYQADLIPMAGEVMPQVNAWADEHTDGMIKEFLSEEPGPLTRLILLNALALDADWDMPFDPDRTKEAAFNALDGQVVVPFMHASRGMEYAEAEGAQAMRLAYDGGQLEMVVILPEAGGLDAALRLIAERGLDWLGEFDYRDEVRLALPKLSMQNSIGLKPLLQAMGVELAFGEAADFSAMTGEPDLYIDEVLQKVRLDVDEQGTRAAAVTGIMMAAKSLVMDSVEMTVDRPFIAVIRDVEGGEPLFVAVVTNPTQA